MGSFDVCVEKKTKPMSMEHSQKCGRKEIVVKNRST